MATTTRTSASPALPWHKAAIAKIEAFDQEYISKIPHIYDCFSQRTRTYCDGKCSDFTSKLTTLFSPLTHLNDWLNQDELNLIDEAWKAYAVFLVKLPLRAVRNIVQLLTLTVHALLYTMIHPAKAGIKLAIVLIQLIKALTQPETWTKMGAGMLGATLGQAAIGNSLAPIGLIVGATLLGVGLCGGVVQTLVKQRQNSLAADLKAMLSQHLKQLPEAFLTGFLMGLIFGAITKARNTIEQQHYKDHLDTIEKNKLAYAQQNSPAGGHTTHDLPSGNTVVKDVNTVISDVQVHGDTVTWTSYQTIKSTHYIRVYPYTGPDSIRIIVSTARTADVARTLTVPFHFSSFNPSSLAHHVVTGAVGATGGASLKKS